MKPRHAAALALVASAVLAAVVYVDWKAVDVAPEPRLMAVSVASAIWVFAITLAVHGTKRPWLLIGVPLVFWWVVAGAIVYGCLVVMCSCGPAPPCNF
jgi:peptidoglycan/LPS O-acetylase OafA/YrhL